MAVLQREVSETEQQTPGERLHPVVRQEPMSYFRLRGRGKGSRGLLLSTLAVTMSVAAVVLLTASCYFRFKARGGGNSLTGALASRRLAEGGDPDVCGETGAAAGPSDEPEGPPVTVDKLMANARLQLELLEMVNEDGSHLTGSEQRSVERARTRLETAMLQLTTSEAVSGELEKQVNKLEKEIEELQQPTPISPFKGDTLGLERQVDELRNRMLGLVVEKTHAREGLMQATYSPLQARSALQKQANSFGMRDLTPVGAAALAAAEKVLTGGPSDIPPLNPVQQRNIEEITKSLRVRVALASADLDGERPVPVQRVLSAEVAEREATLLTQQLYASGLESSASKLERALLKLRTLCALRRSALGLQQPLKTPAVVPPALPAKRGKPSTGTLPSGSLPQQLAGATSGSGSKPSQTPPPITDQPLPPPPPPPRGRAGPSHDVSGSSGGPSHQGPAVSAGHKGGSTSSPPPTPPRRAQSLGARPRGRRSGEPVVRPKVKQTPIQSKSDSSDDEPPPLPPRLPLSPPVVLAKVRQTPLHRKPDSSDEEPPPLPLRPPLSPPSSRQVPQPESSHRRETQGDQRPASLPTTTSSGGSARKDDEYVEMKSRPHSVPFRVVESGPQAIIISTLRRPKGSRSRQKPPEKEGEQKSPEKKGEQKSPEKEGGQKSQEKKGEQKEDPPIKPATAPGLIQLQSAAHHVISGIKETADRLRHAAAVGGPQQLPERINLLSAALVRYRQAANTHPHRALPPGTKSALADAVKELYDELLRLQSVLSLYRLVMTVREAFDFEQTSNGIAEALFSSRSSPPPPPSAGSDEDTQEGK
ncbi:hypothetical protein ACSSS7_006136 [Eimeria intestinalis]